MFYITRTRLGIIISGVRCAMNGRVVNFKFHSIHCHEQKRRRHLHTFGVRCFQNFIFHIRLMSRKAVVIANCKDKFESNLDLTRFIQHLARLEISFEVSSTCSRVKSNPLPVLLLHSRLIVKRKSVNAIVTINSNNASLKLERMLRYENQKVCTFDEIKSVLRFYGSLK